MNYFSEEALTAARNLVRSWGHDLNQSVEDLIWSVNTDVYNHFGCDAKYGVEDAIMSGTRIRLLDQMDSKNLKMNCSERGVNAFLVNAALGVSDSSRILRYNDGRASDHFSVLYYDNGLNGDPWVNDPNDARGRIKILSDGYILYPINWINLRDAEKWDGESRFSMLEPGDMPRKVKAKIDILSAEEVVRHINYINSPLGFFSYFADGQKIKEEQSGAWIRDYNVKTLEDKMNLSINFFDLFKDNFTFERTYSLTDDRLEHRDKYIMHLDYKWVDPLDALFILDKENIEIKRLDKTKKINIAFVSYIKLMLGSKTGHIFSDEQQLEYLNLLKKDNAKLEEKYKLHKENMNKELISFLRGRGIDRKHFNEYRKAESKYNDMSYQISYINSMPSQIQKTFLDQAIYFQMFKYRKVKITRPYTQIINLDCDLTKINKYVRERFSFYKDKIDDFFGSKVVEKLLDQYKDAVNIKRLIEG